MSWKVVQREMVDKNYVLWWDLWFAVMQTVVYSSVVVLGIIVLRVGAVYHDSLILSCYRSDYLSKVPHVLYVLSTISNPVRQSVTDHCACHLAVSLPASVFGASDNNCIMASICDVSDFGCGE